MQDIVVTRRMGMLLAVAVLVGVAAAFVAENNKSKLRAVEQQRIEAAANQARAVKRMADLERAARAEARARERAAEEAAKTPADRRRERIALQFSAWDGSHGATAQAIKAQMNNPDSYAHVVTTYVDHGIGRGLRVTTKFRGTNGFNAVVVNFGVAEVDEAGNVTALSIQR